MRLPDVGAQGGRGTTSALRSPVENRSGQIIAEGLAGVGSTIADLGVSIKKAENASSYASGRSQWAIAEMQTRREVMEDPDFMNWEKNYRDKLPGRLEPILATLSNRDRAQFEQEAYVDIERGGGQLFEEAFKRESDVKVTELGETKVALMDQFLTAKSPEDRARIIHTYSNHVDARHALGCTPFRPTHNDARG